MTNDDTPKSEARTGRLRAGTVLLLVLAAVMGFRLLTFGPPDLNGFDESVYTHYGEVLGRGGVSGLRRVAENWASHEQLRKGPLPFRVAFIGAGALCCRVLGEYRPFGFALVSLVGGLLLAVAGVLLARRWMNGIAGPVVAGVLCGVSPLATGLSRRALQDSMFAALVVLAFWSLDRFMEKRQGRDAAALGSVLFIGFLTKESMLFVYPLLLAIFLIRGGLRNRQGIAPLAAAIILPPVAALGVMAYVAGSLQGLMSTYSTYSEMQRTIPYALAWQQGPWFRYLVDFMLISPVVVLLAAVGATSAGAFSGRGRALLATVLVLGLAVFSCLPLLNLRIVLFLDTPLRILAAGGVVALGQRFGRNAREATLILVGVAAIAMLLDLVQFHTFFVSGGVYDPVTANLIKALGFMP